MAGLGDINNDGWGDALVGARFEDVGANASAGRAYVFSGADGAALLALQSPGSLDVAMFATAVAGVPDADDDGLDDLLISSSVTLAQRTYMFSSSDGSQITSYSSPHPMGPTFGLALAGVPDLDGDGKGEAFIGAEEETGPGNLDSAGRAYLFLSAATGGEGEGEGEGETPPPSCVGGKTGTPLDDLQEKSLGDLLLLGVSLMALVALRAWARE